MKKIDENNYHGSPDKDLDQLLELGKPLPRMPEDLKARIRTRLAEVGQESEKKNFLVRRWAILSPLAAAAVLALFLIFFWPGGTPGTISWADVQKCLDQIQTLAGRYAQITTIEGKPIIFRAKVYLKDPGLSRYEEYTPEADLDTVESRSKSILICKREPGLSEVLTLHPGSGRAEWVTLNGPESPSFPKQLDLASENWKLMKGFTEDKTRRIGERVINGIPAVGFDFETRARELVVSTDADEQAHGEIWAGRDDGVPLLIELEFRNTLGQNVRIQFSDIQWNVPLEESLFDLSVPLDWTLSRTRIESAEYTDTGLASGVTLQTSPDGQEPLAATGDVAAVVWAEQTTDPDSKIPLMGQITIELKPEAAHRLHDYADAHPDKLIVVNFNREINVAAKLDTAHPTRLSFDLSLLGLSLAELEKRYFTTSIERNE